LVDNASRFMDRVRARLERVATGRSIYDSRYPFGITPIAIPNPPPAPDLLETLLSFGFDIPADPPGTGFSFLVTNNRARAGVKVGRQHYPAFHRRSNGKLVAWTEDLNSPNIWDIPTDHKEYKGGTLVDNLFFTPGYGSGTRRDSSMEPRPQWPRFGAVIAGREFVEDPYHAGSGFMALSNLYVHLMMSIGRPSVDVLTMKKHQSHYCNTCYQTLHRGTIVNVRQDQGVVTNVELNGGGFPTQWTFIEGNREGMAEWMVAAEAAYEGNRTLDFCPDPVDIDPDDPTAGRHRFYLIPQDDGIEDFRYDQPMIFIREDELSGVPGYSAHDEEMVLIDGIEYDRPSSRSDYLLGPPNLNPAGSPLTRSENDRVASICDADGPMRRSGFLNVPAIAGLGPSGKAYTSGATLMIDPRVVSRMSDGDDDEDSWSKNWESYDDGWDWGDDDPDFDPDEEFDPDDW